MLKRVQLVTSPTSGEEPFRQKTSENGSNSEASQNTKKLLGDKVVAAYFKNERLKNPLAFKSMRANDKTVNPTVSKAVKNPGLNQQPLASEPLTLPTHSSVKSPGATTKQQLTLPLKQEVAKGSVTDRTWERLLDPNQSWVSIQKVPGASEIDLALNLQAVPPSVHEQNAKRQLFENKQLKEIKKIEKPPVKSKKQYQSIYKVEPVKFGPGSAPGQFKIPPSVIRLKDEHSNYEMTEEDEKTPANILNNFSSQKRPEWKTQNAKTMKKPLDGKQKAEGRKSAFGIQNARQNYETQGTTRVVSGTGVAS